MVWGFGADYGGVRDFAVSVGNVLVPLLFSEANDLHPVAIIVAILAFGSLWGIWVCFAIPLATLIKAIFNAWPRSLVSAPTQLSEKESEDK